VPVLKDNGLITNVDYYRDGYRGVPVTTTVEGKQVTTYKDGYLPRTLGPVPNSPASIRVYGKSTGAKATAKDRDLIPAFTKFIMNSVQEGHQERVQIVETFSDFYMFFYGERPPIYTYNGMLINSKNANWVADFMYYYEDHLRGTKCAEHNAKLILTYGGRQVEGYILSMNTSTTAESEQGVPVSFQVVITKRSRIGFSDDFLITLSNGKVVVEDEAIRKMIEGIAGAAGKGTASTNNSKAFSKANSVAGGKAPAAGPTKAISKN
jgi:hypothetical protein